MHYLAYIGILGKGLVYGVRGILPQSQGQNKILAVSINGTLNI